MKVKITHSCPTLCDPIESMEFSRPEFCPEFWVAVPFSRGFSQPRDQTQVSRIAGRFFTSGATREALKKKKAPKNSISNRYELP